MSTFQNVQIKGVPLAVHIIILVLRESIESYIVSIVAHCTVTMIFDTHVHEPLRWVPREQKSSLTYHP